MADNTLSTSTRNNIVNSVNDEIYYNFPPRPTKKNPKLKLYYPSIKTSIDSTLKRKKNNRLFTINERGKKYVFIQNEKVLKTIRNENNYLNTNISNHNRYIRKKPYNNYKNFFSDKIINIDNDNFYSKIEDDFKEKRSGTDGVVYTWIMTKLLNESENININTIKIYMSKVLSSQEIGTLHRNLNALHKRRRNDKSIIIGAGELKVTSPTTIEFNLFSGTFMKDDIVFNKKGNEKNQIEDNIAKIVISKFKSKDIEAKRVNNEFIKNSNIRISNKNLRDVLQFFDIINNNNNNNNKKRSTKKTKGPPNKKN